MMSTDTTIKVVNRLGDDPRSGAVFVFINRSHNLLKLLHWDGTGIWILARRMKADEMETV